MTLGPGTAITITQVTANPSTWAVAGTSPRYPAPRPRRAAESPSAEAEERIQAHGKAGRQPDDATDREQHPGHERRPVQRVVPDGEHLAGPAEEHLLVGDQAG